MTAVHGAASPLRDRTGDADHGVTDGAVGIAVARRLEGWLWGMVLLGAPLLAAWWSRSGFPAQARLEDLLAWIRGLGPWGPALVVALLALETLVAPLPGMPLVTASAVVYGPVAGFLLGWSGAWLGSSLAFALARRWLHRRVWERLDPRRRELVRRLGERHGFALLVLLRLFPLTSVDWLAYAAGVSTMPFRTYALATGLGLIPGVTSYVLAGYSVRRARDLEAGLAAAGGALLGAYLVAAWWRRRAGRLRRRG